MTSVSKKKKKVLGVFSKMTIFFFRFLQSKMTLFGGNLLAFNRLN